LKASDPTSSFSTVASTVNAFVQQQLVSGVQAGDVIHVAVIAGSATTCSLEYRTFDMSSDSWVLHEVVVGTMDPTNNAAASVYGCAIAFRSSDSQPVILFNGENVASMGASYSRIYVAYRTGTNAWTIGNGGSPIDVGGTVNGSAPEIVSGASSRTHLIYRDNNGRQRTLTSANALQTDGSFGHSTGGSVVSYDVSGTIKVRENSGSTTTTTIFGFDSADTPSYSSFTSTGSGPGQPSRLFYDTGDARLWVLGRSSTDSDLYVTSSTNDASSWSTPVKTFTATVNGNDYDLSKFGTIYQRGNDIVIPYVVVDNGTMKYNEHVVRTVAAPDPIGKTKLYSQVVKRASFW
jgi:hypothetical protein